jgi:hypothetical protein
MKKALANAGGSVLDGEKRLPGNFVKPFVSRARMGTR